MTDQDLRALERAAARDPQARRRLVAELKRRGFAPAFPITNVRYGFATNSSSSHSIILAEGLADNEVGVDSDLCYGWGNFILASREAKAQYFAVAMLRHYWTDSKLGFDEAVSLVRKFLPLDGVSNETLRGSYIDHQSSPTFPRPRLPGQGMVPLWDFYREEIVENDKVAILGGNDNDEWEGRPEGEEFSPYADVVDLDAQESRKVYRKDRTGHFSVFNYENGTKVRFAPTGVAIPKRAATPELVDVKITNYCGMGCTYCYQDSTAKGKHAPTERLTSLAYNLKDMGVFEVAIGGGEPTDHPDFPEILRNFDHYGTKPSFSTQSWEWLKRPEIWEAVKRYCGAVALSTQNPAHVRPWLEQTKQLGIKAHFHYVLGLSPLENLGAFVRELGRDADDWTMRGHLVLLAFKSVGRGKRLTPHATKGWGKVLVDALEDRRWAWTVAVDSFLVDEIDQEFVENRPNGVLYEKSDGRFSCYYDAVEDEWAVHSFEPKERRVTGKDLEGYDDRRFGQGGDALRAWEALGRFVT